MTPVGEERRPKTTTPGHISGHRCVHGMVHRRDPGKLVKGALQQVHGSQLLVLLTLCRHLSVPGLNAVFLHSEWSTNLELEKGRKT